MNTGHEGSLSTGHANSVRDMLYRLETMVLGGMALPIEAIRRQICSAIDIVIHLSKFRDHVRRIDEIYEVTDMIGGEIGLNPLYVMESAAADDAGGTSGPRYLLKSAGNSMVRTDKLEKAGMIACAV